MSKKQEMIQFFIDKAILEMEWITTESMVFNAPTYLVTGYVIGTV